MTGDRALPGLPGRAWVISRRSARTRSGQAAITGSRIPRRAYNDRGTFTVRAACHVATENPAIYQRRSHPGCRWRYRVNCAVFRGKMSAGLQEQLRGEVFRRIDRRCLPATAAGAGDSRIGGRAGCRYRDLASRFRRGRRRRAELVREHLLHQVQRAEQPGDPGPQHTVDRVHAPNTLITEHAVHTLGLSSSITYLCVVRPVRRTAHRG